MVFESKNITYWHVWVNGQQSPLFNRSNQEVIPFPGMLEKSLGTDTEQDCTHKSPETLSKMKSSHST